MSIVLDIGEHEDWVRKLARRFDRGGNGLEDDLFQEGMYLPQRARTHDPAGAVQQAKRRALGKDRGQQGIGFVRLLAQHKRGDARSQFVGLFCVHASPLIEPKPPQPDGALCTSSYGPVWDLCPSAQPCHGSAG